MPQLQGVVQYKENTRVWFSQYYHKVWFLSYYHRVWLLPYYWSQGVVSTSLLQGVVSTILSPVMVFTILPQGVVFTELPQGLVFITLPQGVILPYHHKMWFIYSYLRSISIGRVVSRRATNLRTLLSSPFLKEDGKKKLNGTIKFNEERYFCL